MSILDIVILNNIHFLRAIEDPRAFLRSPFSYSRARLREGPTEGYQPLFYQLEQACRVFRNLSLAL
jgi:hypothetical protein